MDANHADASLAHVARAIAEPARARILCCLLDGQARTSTELAIVAEVSPSTTSVHLMRLKEQRLVVVTSQGKHRYYKLAGTEVGAALEALLVVAGTPRVRLTTRTPKRLRAARTCYDHMAGSVAVMLHDHFFDNGWLTRPVLDEAAYELTPHGIQALQQLGVDVKTASALRRRFACACLDWSERRPHLGGALGAGVFQFLLKHRWMEQDTDSRVLRVTEEGCHQFNARLGVQVEQQDAFL